MAGNLSDYAVNALVAESVGKTAYTLPTVYLALSTTDFTATGASGTEPAGANGYARQDMTGKWGAVTGGVVHNASAVTFGPNTTAPWGTIAYVAMFDDPTAGNCLWFGACTSRAIAVGDSYQFAINGLTVTLD